VWLTHDDVFFALMREFLANAKIQAVAYFNFFAIRPNGDGFAGFHGVARRQDEHAMFFDVALNDDAIF
jgi:hypothetical protein